jgi:hypothetical protein
MFVSLPCPAGSSAAAGSDVIKTIRDSKTDFTTMVYIINAGCDYQFWQVRASAGSTQHFLCCWQPMPA